MEKQKNNNINVSITKTTYDDYRNYLEKIKKYCNNFGTNNAWDLMGKMDHDGQPIMGARLAYILKDSNIEKLTVNQFIDALQKTKKPVFMNEQQGKIDGSDWIELENKLLLETPTIISNIKIHSNSTVQIDNQKTVTITELDAELINTTEVYGVCGSLFKGNYTTDENFLLKELKCIKQTKNITDDDAFKAAYYNLVEGRFLASLAHINSKKDRQLISTSIVGEGAFGGKYRDRISKVFPEAIQALFERYKLSNIKGFIIADGNTDIQPQIIGKDSLLIHAPINAAFKHRRIYAEAMEKTHERGYNKISNDELLTYETNIWSAGDPFAMPGSEAAKGTGGSFDAATGLFTDLLLTVYAPVKGWINPKDNRMRHEDAKWHNFDHGSPPTFENTCDSNQIQLRVGIIHVINEIDKNTEVQYIIENNDNYKPAYLKVVKKKENNAIITYYSFATDDFEELGDGKGKINTCQRSLEVQEILNARKLS